MTKTELWRKRFDKAIENEDFLSQNRDYEFWLNKESLEEFIEKEIRLAEKRGAKRRESELLCAEKESQEHLLDDF